MLAYRGLGGKHAPRVSGPGINHSAREVGSNKRITDPLPFCHISHCTMGSKSLYFPLKWSSMLSDRLMNAPTQCTNYKNPGEGDFTHAIEPRNLRWRKGFIQMFL